MTEIWLGPLRLRAKVNVTILSLQRIFWSTWPLPTVARPTAALDVSPHIFAGNDGRGKGRIWGRPVRDICLSWSCALLLEGLRWRYCQWNSSLPLMLYRRQSIQSALLTACKIPAIMPLGAQTKREHQSTRTRKAPKMRSPSVPLPLLFSPSQQL